MKIYHSKKELTDDIEFLRYVIPKEGNMDREKTICHLTLQMVEQWRITSPDSPWYVGSISSRYDSKDVLAQPSSITVTNFLPDQTEKDAANTLINIHNTETVDKVSQRRSKHYNLRSR